MTNLSILQPKCDQDIVRALKALLVQAQAGQLVGFAYVALKPGYEYSGDLIGKAMHHPVMALGLARALEEQITTLLR